MKRILLFFMAVLMITSTAFADEVVVAQDGTTPAKKESAVKFRGLKSVDTLNVTYGTFSPFNGEDREREGHFVNVKARVRPLRIGKTDLGVVASYTKGSSDSYKRSADRWSYYDYEIVGLGASGVYHHTKNSETELEVEWLHQKTDGRVPKKDFWSHQHEQQIALRLKYDTEERRAAGESWIPYWDLGVRYVHPFDVTYSDSKGRGDGYAYDNRRLDIWGSIDIYDWYLDDSEIWRVSPTFNADLMHLWGKDSWGIQGGFGFKIAAYEEELVDIKLFNPRWLFEGNGSRLYDFIGTWKIDNTFRAIWASQTETYVSPREKARIAQMAAQ
jgi:hypothetical protein